MKIIMNRLTLLALAGFSIAGMDRAGAEAPAAFSHDVPQFSEQATDAGVAHQFTGPWEYFVGGGAASFDCNADRVPDLFLAGGTGAAKLFVNRSKAKGPIEFEMLETGLSESEGKRVIGAYPIDINNDRLLDLVVLRLGRNIVLEGQGNCQFKKANRAFSFEGGRAWSTAFSAIWENHQAFPTLAIGNYVDRSAPGSPWGTCHPNKLMRPVAGDQPNYQEPLALEPGYCALSMLFTDWNRSGSPALRVTNDRQYYRGGQEQLWELPTGRLPRQYSTAQGWKALKIWGMGIAEADLNADGLPEYALTSMGDTKIQSLDEEAGEDRPTYRDIAYERGATAHRPYTGDDRRPSTGWHSQFSDFNNDAMLDLYIAKGNVERMSDFANYDPDNLLMGSGTGRFIERGDAAGIALDRRGRGAVVEDFNMDGMLDLIVVNREAPASIFRNLGAPTEWGHRPLGNWIKIELDNGKINPNAVGARISVKTGNLSQVRKIQVGGGHASGQMGFSHVGLGVAERAVVRVEWPDGEWSHPYRVFANQHIIIKRGETNAKYWYPR